MIVKFTTNSTFVICGDCGSTIYATDPENVVQIEGETVWLRCRNNCCGHVARYSASDFMIRPQGHITDHTTSIFLES